MNKRDPNWPTLLIRFIEARRDCPFEWGVQDCCSFARDWVKECTGREIPMPSYHDALSAERAIAELGSLPDALTRYLELVPVNQAQRGDICLMSLRGRDTLGILVGAQIVGPGLEKLAYVPRSAAGAAWAV